MRADGPSQAAVLSAARDDFAVGMMKVGLAPVQVLISAPSLLFLAALTAMLLRHPDVHFFAIDRVAFGVLVLGVATRALVMQEPLFVFERATWPMIGLTTLAVISVVGQSFDHETWSLLASKFIVPFTLFHIAGLVFREEKQFRQFEIFALIVLAYLSFTAIAFLTGMHSLIFPRFILDESLGFHADRARGPLLQAVANGVSLNVLGLLGIHTYQRASVGRRKLLVVLASLPLAILATMTRMVWLAFAGSVLAVLVRSGSRVVRHVRIGLLITVVLGIVVLSGSQSLSDSLSERLKERGPIDYRAAVYSADGRCFCSVRGWVGDFIKCRRSCRGT